MTPSNDGVPPQAPHAEDAVLGAILQSATALDACAELLAPDDFYRASNGRVYAAALRLHAKAEPVDVLTVAAELGQDIYPRLRELVALAPATANAAHHARLVKDAALRRGLIRVAQEAVKEAHGDGSIDRIEQELYALSNTVPDVDLDPDAQGYIQTLQHLRDNPGALVGVPSGFHALDEITQGFVPGNLIVVGARPSMGKSALALCVTANLLGRGMPVAIVSLEMSKPEIMQRLVSIGASLPGEKLRNPRRLTDEEWQRAEDAARRLSTKPIYVREAGALTPLEVRSQVRRLKARVPELALVVVDYLQLMTTGHENRVQEVSEISRSLKQTARDMDIPVMALSQLSRALEQRTDKRPVLSDLRESGSIEQDADLVLFLYRESYYSGEEPPPGWLDVVEVNVAKHRNGPTDRVRLGFKREQARFTELPRGSHIEAA